MVNTFAMYTKRILIAIDQLFNALFLGSPDETLSARAYRLREQGWWFAYAVINLLFFWQEDHCAGSYMSEVLRKHLPEEYRE
jgi:hypothetical protein